MIIFVLLLGLGLGSLTNATVWRTRQQLKAKSNKEKQKYSILSGRSMCPGCRRTLSPADLIPIISWLALGGKCRYCKQKIHWQYPLVEAVVAAAVIISFIFWPYEFSGEGLMRFVIWAGALVILAALLIYDLNWMLLPDKLTKALFALAFLQLLAGIIFYGGGTADFIDAVFGVLALGGLFYLLFIISDGRWIGGGDVKLGISLGILAGDAARALLVIFLASVIGTFVSIGLMAAKKVSSQTKIPFGPFLIVSLFVVQLFGSDLIDWYKTHLLLI